MMAFMGSMALGSLFWGNLAKDYGIETSLLTAASGMFSSILITWRFSINGHETVDLTSSMLAFAGNRSLAPA